MANYVDGSNGGFISTNDLSAVTSGQLLAIGKIVKIDSSNAPQNIVLAGANGTGAIGVLLDAPAAGQVGTVRFRNAGGTASIRLNGTVTVGAAITSDASGLGIATTTAGDQIVGYALSAGVAGDMCECLLVTAKY